MYLLFVPFMFVYAQVVIPDHDAEYEHKRNEKKSWYVWCHDI